MGFTVEEQALLSYMDCSDRTKLSVVIGSIRHGIDDPPLKELLDSILEKLEIMSDSEFSEQAFSDMTT